MLILTSIVSVHHKKILQMHSSPSSSLNRGQTACKVTQNVGQTVLRLWSGVHKTHALHPP
jgi:hypothetical protein